MSGTSTNCRKFVLSNGAVVLLPILIRGMSTHPQSLSFMHMKSVSEADESLFKPILRAPYLQVTVVKMCNLEQLEQHNLEPYLVLTHGESRFETSVLVSGELLMQTFEVDIVHLQPLGIFVMDKDDYGKHSVISSLLIPAFYFAKWVGKTHELCIRIEPSDLSESEDSEPHTYTLSDDLLLTDGERLVQPHLHLRILVMDECALNQLRVSITEHRIRSTVTETFTQYAAEVVRGDGMKWYTKLRYSQISALRKSLIGTFPEFEKVSFPRKTYLDCLSGVCSNMSRFSEGRIEERKKGLETFINTVLQKPKFISDPLLELLQAQPPSHILPD